MSELLTTLQALRGAMNRVERAAFQCGVDAATSRPYDESLAEWQSAGSLANALLDAAVNLSISRPVSA